MILSLTLAAALAAAPPEKHPLTIDDLVALPRVDSPDASPDGKLVAFTVARATASGERFESALYLVATAGGEPRRLTFASEKVTSPRFSPDGRRIAFLSDRAGAPRPFLVDVDGGEARPAATFPWEASALLWAPDGKALVVLADVDPACGADAACHERRAKEAEGKPRVATRLLFRHWSSWRERMRTHLLRVPLDGGAPTDLTPGDRDVPPYDRGGIHDVSFSPGGQDLLYVAVADPVEAISTNGDVYSRSAAGGAERRLTFGPGWDGTPRCSPDGRRLAWRSQARAGYESDKFRLLLSGRDGARPRDLTEGLDLSVREFWWSGDDRLLFVAEEMGGSGLYQIDLRSGRPRRLWSGPNLHEISPSRDGRVAVALLDSFARPPEVAVIEDGKVRVVTRFSDEIMESVALGTARRANARVKDGAVVQGWILTPPGHRPGERHPAVVLIHGGPELAWDDSWHFRWNAQLYAAQGWTVVMPNVRGSSGYGMAWQEGIRDDWGGAPYEDLMAFADMAVSSGDADGQRMCAAGASYGGYLVNWINGQTRAFRCLVDHAGWLEMRSSYYDTEELWFPEWELGTPWEKPEAYDRWSPERYVARWKTPTLVTHGELDYRVTVNHGYATFTALQRLGIESRLVVFPDEGHHILKPRNARAFHREVFDWIRAHLAAAGGAVGAADR